MNVKVADTIFPSIQIHMRSDDYTFKMGTNDYLFQLHEPIKNPDPSKYYMTAELSSGEFPVSFFNVNETNNKMMFSYGFPVTGVSRDYTITIPVGNYNMGQLLTELDKQLGLTFPSGNNHEQGGTELKKPVISWSSLNNKFSIQVFSQFLFSTRNSTIKVLLGLTQEDDNLTSVSGTLSGGVFTPDVPSTIIGNSMCDIRGYTNLFLHTDLFSNGYSSNVQKDNNTHNVIARVPVDAGAYGTILYKPFIPHNVPIAKNSFKVFRISIKDPEGRLIDMNHMNWSATITIRFHKINNATTDYQSPNTMTGGFTSTSTGTPTEHLLRSWIDDITNEYRDGKLDYSRLGVN